MADDLQNYKLQLQQVICVENKSKTIPHDASVDKIKINDLMVVVCFLFFFLLAG